MATRADIQAKLAAIDQRKVEALKALQAKRAKLKAKLAQLDRPTKSARRLDARRKILLGAFVLEHRYWSVVENRRVSGNRTVQRHVLYLGEINDSQQAAWSSAIEVFDECDQTTKQVALFPEHRSEERSVV